MNDDHSAQCLRRFIGFYASANIGAVVAFIPLLTLILPIKVNVIDPANKIVLLSVALCVGGFAASFGNILAGWLSDKIVRRTGHRFHQIGLGLATTILCYYVFWLADDWFSLIMAIIVFQLSLNLLYAPIIALLADYIPDQSKGLTAAYLNLGVPIGGLMIAILTLTIFDTEAARLCAVAGVLVVTVAPLLCLAKWGEIPPMVQYAGGNSRQVDSEAGSKINISDLRWAWASRFFIQFSGALLFGYIVYYVQDIINYATIFPGRTVDQAVGTLNILAIPFAVTAGMGAGYISDRVGARRPFLYIAAAMTALALAILAYVPSWPMVILAFTLFSAALSVFQTIDIALVTQIVTQSPKRARIMGYMNLTNTLPAIIAPALALILSSNSLPNQVLITLLTVSACLAVLAILAISRIESVR